MKSLKDRTPPRFALRLLSWFCPAHLYEEIEGDLIQRFQRDVKLYGERRAKRKFLWNTIRFLRPGIVLRNKLSPESMQLSLLTHNLKYATRIFLKDKFFSTLNIFGLALGIAVGIVLLMILQSDLTFDQHYVNHERIYRLAAHQQSTGDDFMGATTAPELAPALKDEFPEIEAFVRIEPWGRSLISFTDKNHDKSFYEENIIRVDSSYFQIFNHIFLVGDRASCLHEPNSVVLTRSMAKKYFDDEDPLNKVLNMAGVLAKVTAVIEDVPENTHLKFGVLLSQITHRDVFKERSEAFWNPEIYTYLLMKEKYDVKDFYSKFPTFYNRHLKVTGDQIGGKYTPILEPLASIHMHSDMLEDFPQGDILFLYALVTVGIFIILLACINYMNLSTAKSLARAGEIAVKKTFGSSRSILAISFLVESLLLSVISLAVAVLLITLLLQATTFNQLIGKNLKWDWDFLANPFLLMGSVFIAIGIGLLSGLYPAFVLSKIPAIKVLKSTLKNSKAGLNFRRMLILSQFSISILVVICTLLMRDQIEFVRTKNLGFNQENIIVLPVQDEDAQTRLNAMKTTLLTNPDIISVTATENVIGISDSQRSLTMWAEHDTGVRLQNFIVFFTDADFLKTMDIKIAAGQDFNSNQKDVFLANETAVKIMGWESDPIGKRVKTFHDKKEFPIIGVVKDFNFQSLHNAVEPTLIGLTKSDFWYLHVRVSGNLSKTIDYLHQQWRILDPKHPFEYFFLDQRFNEQYNYDEAQNKLLIGLSGICIFISLLGLIGLSAFAVTQRTKEIGIRKILGARFSHIVLLLSREAIMMVSIAAIAMTPVSAWIVGLWEEDFAYRAPLDYIIYVLVTIVALGLVFLTVLFQSYRTTQKNPIDVLKYE